MGTMRSLSHGAAREPGRLRGYAPQGSGFRQAVGSAGAVSLSRKPRVSVREHGVAWSASSSRQPWRPVTNVHKMK